jgi:methyltransferase (TIGR00027 family)
MALRSHVLLRSRFAEERLRGAVARGVTQLIVLGTGLDTFAYRQPPWASALRIYEVDHPASQAAKRARLEAAGIAIPSNVTFAPIDFEHDTLASGLARAGFDPAAKTFVSCLGVLVYLTSEAIAELFAFVASLPAGSECVFTFGGTRGPEDEGRPSLASVAADLGEPWVSSMEIEDVTAMLARAGLPAPLLMSREDAAVWLGTRTDGLELPRRERVATVVNDALPPNESLAGLLVARARAASDGRLILDVASGLLAALALAIWHPRLWLVPFNVAIVFAAFGGWGLTDRELAERAGSADDSAVPVLRVLRVLSAVVGAGSAIVAGVALFGMALGTWMS